MKIRMTTQTNPRQPAWSKRLRIEFVRLIAAPAISSFRLMLNTASAPTFWWFEFLHGNLKLRSPAKHVSTICQSSCGEKSRFVASPVTDSGRFVRGQFELLFLSPSAVCCCVQIEGTNGAISRAKTALDRCDRYARRVLRSFSLASLMPERFSHTRLRRRGGSVSLQAKLKRWLDFCSTLPFQFGREFRPALLLAGDWYSHSQVRCGIREMGEMELSQTARCCGSGRASD